MKINSYTKKQFRQFSLWGGLCLCMALSLGACSSDDPEIPEPEPEPTPTPKPEPEPEPTIEWKDVTATPDTWDKQKRADIAYQLLVYSFADSNGDGWAEKARQRSEQNAKAASKKATKTAARIK